jgi:TolA-binding protein
MEGALVYYGHLASDRSTAEGTEAYYYLVLDKFQKGDYATAEQMVYDLGMCGSMYWQAKCFLVLGDIFVALDNSFQARATYQSIVDGYSPKDDGIVEEAQQRINSLK